MSTPNSKLRAAILIVSETAYEDPSTDKCIPILKEVFSSLGNDQWDVAETEIVPDSVLAIQKTIRNWTDGANPINLIISSGGTGFATKDVTPEVRHLVKETDLWLTMRAGGNTIDRQTCARTCVSDF